MQVTARLYLRENDRQARHRAADQHVHLRREPAAARDDYRPEVHDSDGLSIQLGDGEWIWRPLVNPKRLLVTSFAHDQPARLRPDAARPLVGELRGPRGALRAPAERVGRAGRQLGRRAASSWCRSRRPTRPTTTSSPTGCPQAPPAPGKPLDIAYRIRWQSGGHDRLPQGLGRADAARPRLRQAARRRHQLRRRLRRPGAARAGRRRPNVEPVIWVDANAEVRERNLFSNEVSGAWRMTVRIKRIDAAKPVELRAYLQASNRRR